MVPISFSFAYKRLFSKHKSSWIRKALAIEPTQKLKESHDLYLNACLAPCQPSCEPNICVFVLQILRQDRNLRLSNWFCCCFCLLSLQNSNLFLWPSLSLLPYAISWLRFASSLDKPSVAIPLILLPMTIQTNTSEQVNSSQSPRGSS